MAQPGLMGELWSFMRQRKKFWLLPVLTILLLVGALLVFAQGSALAVSSRGTSRINGRMSA